MLNTSTKFNLAELVSYQGGAVVSREIIQKPSGTVTVFAFDAGQGLSDHKAPFDALVQILDGRAQIKIADEIFSLETGEMIIMPADTIHALKAEERFKMSLTMIR